MGQPRPPLPLLLALLLLLPAEPGPARPRGLCPALCRCRRRLLDCSGALPAPNGSWAAAGEREAWRQQLWAEALVLQDNGLQAVKRHSLEGLLLLKHLDLSHNKILVIEECAFEPLPFLQLLNLDGNLITQLWNGTFQAWHGMQFLERLILSHNPLAVIADTAFFRLPSLKYLDLGATEVTQQSLLRLLLTTACLETLKVPRDVACCLCQEKHPSEAQCRTIKFHCEALCSAGSAPQCAPTGPLAEAQGELMEAAQSSSLNSSSMLKLQPQEPSLRDPGTVTLGVVLSLTRSGADGRNPAAHSSRSSSHSPQHLSRQEGKTIKELLVVLQSIQHLGWGGGAGAGKVSFLARALLAELKEKLQEAKSDLSVAHTLPALSLQKDEVQETPAVEGETNMGWEQGQHGLGVNPWVAAGSSNPTLGSSRQHRIPRPPPAPSLPHPPAQAPRLSEPFKIQTDWDAVGQTKKAPGMEAVEGVGDAEGAESPRQDHVWTPRGHKRRHSRALPDPHQLFYRTPGKVQPEEEPPAREGMPHAAEAPWKQEKEGSSLPNKPGSSHSPGRESAGGDPLEAAVREELRPPVPERALRGTLARLARALLGRCSLPQLQPACAKLLLRTGLLIKLLSQRQAEQAASLQLGQCGLQGNVSVGLAEEEKAKNTFSDSLLLGLAVFVVLMINLLVICLVEAHSRKHAAASHPQSSRKSLQRGFFRRLLPRGWSKSKDGDGEDSPVWNPTQTQPQWLQDLFEPLDPQQERAMAQLCLDSSDEEIFSRPQRQFPCWKSRGGQEVPPPGVPGALPHVSSTPQQLALGSGCPEEGAGGSPVLGVPQSSSR